MKSISAVVLGVLGLIVFALVILGETYLPRVDVRFLMLASLLGVIISGELILLGLGRDK